MRARLTPGALFVPVVAAWVLGLPPAAMASPTRAAQAASSSRAGAPGGTKAGTRHKSRYALAAAAQSTPTGAGAALVTDLELEPDDQNDGCHLVGGSFEAAALRAGLVEVATAIWPLSSAPVAAVGHVLSAARERESTFEDARAPADLLRAALWMLADPAGRRAAHAGVLDVCRASLTPLRPASQVVEPVGASPRAPGWLPANPPREAEPHLVALTLLGLGLLVGIVQQGRSLANRA